MNYELNGKTIRIPDKDIQTSIKTYGITKEEAIQMWLEDEGYLDNEEVDKLTAQAKDVMRTIHEATTVKQTTEKKTRTVKISDEKQSLFNALYEFLSQNCGYEVEIKTNNKLLGVKINEKEFKIDLIETRVKKNAEKGGK